MRILCECGKRLRVDDALIGKAVRCPVCNTVLKVQAEPEEIEPEEEAPRPVRRRRDFDEDDEPPLPRRKKKRKKKATASFALIWLLVGGAAVALAAVLTVTFWPRGGTGPNSDTPVANKPGTNPDASKPGGNKGPSGTEGPWVELSEPKFTVVGPLQLRASVKYRFTKGAPLEHLKYLVMVRVDYPSGGGNGMLMERDGRIVNPEGVLEGEVIVGRPIPEGETISYELTMNTMRSLRGGELKAISDPLKGSTIRAAGEGPRVALSEPKVTRVARDKLHASIKYRFTRGKPVAGTTYSCLVFLNTGNIKLQQVGRLGDQDGSAMPAEGMLETEIPLIQPLQESAVIRYEFIMMSGSGGPPGKSPGKPLSDPVRGSTR
jgi:hypothetical protein